MNAPGFDYWAFFAADARRTGSPLYARLAEGVGGDGELKALAALARPGQPHANLLLGAVHFLLLRGAQHPLRRHYPDLGGGARAGEDPFPPFRDFAASHREEIARLVESRVTNTNEVGRSAVLHPGFRAAAAEAGAPLHAVEIGPSAGLNMIWDRYGVRYLRDDAIAGAVNPGAALMMDCALRGARVPPLGATPRPAGRVGLELNPVDLADADDRDWLRALMWPDQVERLHRLDRAIELFAQEKPPIRHGDALDLLPQALAEIPAGEAPCVYHTIAIYQFDAAMKQALEDILAVAGLRRPVWRLAFEFDGKECTLSLLRYHDGVRRDRLLARAHPHGAWIEWIE
ncbi:MAG TPA: DUF2332 domain-containing protein [Rhizomicrobium sp.]|nr:DUF2332 domain-containing protein [Rhizomicrobium sp.]